MLPGSWFQSKQSKTNIVNNDKHLLVQFADGIAMHKYIQLNPKVSYLCSNHELQKVRHSVYSDSY